MKETIYRLPHDFIKRMQAIYPNGFAQILETFLRKKTTTFRINYLKIDLVGLRRKMIEERVHALELQFPKGAFLLKDSLRDFQTTSIYKNGWVYVQNVSSMLPVLLLEPKNNEVILDLCAAPGTKTTQIISLAPEAQVTAIEKNRIRYYKLLANLTYQGIKPIQVRPGPYQKNDGDEDFNKSHQDAKENSLDEDFLSQELNIAQETLPQTDSWTNMPKVKVYLLDGIWARKKFPEGFDKILVDAPCSAEGRFWAQDPRSFKYWRRQKIKEMVHTQRKLLYSAFYALKEGGKLVYSTCTFAPEENEENIEWFCEKFKGQIELLPIDIALPNAYKGLSSWESRKFKIPTHITRRIIPNDYMEGFFVAKLQKLAS